MHPMREQIVYLESTGQKREARASGCLSSVRLLDEECVNGVKHDLVGESFCDTFLKKYQKGRVLPVLKKGLSWQALDDGS